MEKNNDRLLYECEVDGVFDVGDCIKSFKYLVEDRGDV
jgi:hypothetical protein